MERLNRKQLAECIQCLSRLELDALLTHVPEEEAAAIRAIHQGELEKSLRVFPDVADDGPPTDAPARSTDEGNKHPRLLPLNGCESLDPVEQILLETEPALLARLLTVEHPQIVTVVLSQLPPNLSATVLSIFPSEFRAEILRRTAELEPPDAEALADLRCELMNQIARESKSRRDDTNAWERVTALLGAADAKQRQSLWASLEEVFPTLVRPDAAQAEVASLMVGTSDATTDDEPSDLSLLLRLSANALERLVSTMGTKGFAITVAGADSEVWRVIQQRLPRDTARRLRKELCRIGNVDLQDLAVARSLLIETARQSIDGLHSSAGVVVVAGAQANSREH